MYWVEEDRLVRDRWCKLTVDCSSSASFLTWRSQWEEAMEECDHVSQEEARRVLENSLTRSTLGRKFLEQLLNPQGRDEEGKRVEH